MKFEKGMQATYVTTGEVMEIAEIHPHTSGDWYDLRNVSSGASILSLSWSEEELETKFYGWDFPDAELIQNGDPPVQGLNSYADLGKEVFLPADSVARKELPIASGPIAYFGHALAAVGKVCLDGNRKHAPGSSKLTWVKPASADHTDAMVRHMVDANDAERAGDVEAMLYYKAQVAWRALAELETSLEHNGGLEALLRHVEK